MQWSTDIAVARCDERLQFAAQVGAASTSFIVRLAAIYLGRARIVSEILARHSCWIGSTPLVAQKQQIAAADVATFVESQLLSASRLVPIIVVTADRFTDRTVIDDDRMQQKLHGFAQVAVLDKWASFQLTDQIRLARRSLVSTVVYREFIVDGKKRKIYQHVDLGGGDRKACLQIYFEPDRTMGRVVI